ncbi:replicative DNA helicase [Paenibacillus sp. RUD330]|nr:replicative DNA helicase [Paenibacillus sp. RUD330]
MELPHSPEAEQSLLGAIILANIIQEAASLVSTEQFYDRKHQRIYRAMLAMAEEGEVIDLVTLTACLQAREELAACGNVSYLSYLAQRVPSERNFEYYAEIIRSRHLKRRLIETARQQYEDALREDDHHAVIAGMQASAILLADQSATKKEFQKISVLLVEAFEQIEDRYANRSKGGVTGIPSGFPDLDRMTSGFQKSDLIIVAARPSVGKTAFALNVAQHAGVRAGKKVAVFSLEMSSAQLVQRMMSAEQNVDASKLRTGYLEGDDWERLTLAVGSLAEADIYIDDSPVMTVQDIAAKCRRLHKQCEGLDMILIDYLQLIAGRGKSGDNRQQEVSDISRTLKQLARELDLPVIALSQLSRAVEQRQDKRPMMSDLRESGAIEQDADIVAFLYREDYYDKSTEKKNIIEIIIAKQRNGPVGTVELAFLKNFNKFVSLDRDPHPYGR